MILKNLHAEPFLSIITPVYNGESTILKTIESIRKQKFSDFEYIIIDSNSNDNTSNIINNNIDIIDRYVCEKDSGIYDAMNKGIALARGKYIGIINSDDQYNINAFENVYKAFVEGDGETIFFSDLVLAYKSEKVFLKADNSISSIGLGISQISHPTMFVPRSIYLKFGAFNLNFDNYGADRELVLRFKRKKIKFFKVDYKLSTFNFGGSTSKYNLKNIIKQIYQEFYLQKSYFSFSMAIKTSLKFSLRLLRNLFFSMILPNKLFLKLRLNKLGLKM